MFFFGGVNHVCGSRAFAARRRFFLAVVVIEIPQAVVAIPSGCKSDIVQCNHNTKPFVMLLLYVNL